MSPGERRRRQRKREQAHAAYVAKLTALKDRGASCRTCEHFCRGDQMTPDHCEIGTDFHGYQVTFADNLCTNWDEAMITIDGKKVKVLDSLGYNHDIGAYVKRVEIDGKPQMAVGTRGSWRLWTARDRTRPLREAIANGWPNTGKAAAEDKAAKEDEGHG